MVVAIDNSANRIIEEFMIAANSVVAEFIFKNDEPHLLEVNTVPGLTKESILPQQAAAAGISMADLFSNAVEEALL